MLGSVTVPDGVGGCAPAILLGGQPPRIDLMRHAVIAVAHYEHDEHRHEHDDRDGEDNQYSCHTSLLVGVFAVVPNKGSSDLGRILGCRRCTLAPSAICPADGALASTASGSYTAPPCGAIKGDQMRKYQCRPIDTEVLTAVLCDKCG